MVDFIWTLITLLEMATCIAAATLLIYNNLQAATFCLLFAIYIRIACWQHKETTP